MRNEWPIYRLPEVRRMAGTCRKNLYDLLADGVFPIRVYAVWHKDRRSVDIKRFSNKGWRIKGQRG